MNELLTHDSSPTSSRRQWLSGAARWTGLAALLAVVGVTATRRTPDGACPQRTPCDRCGSLSRCTLPQAASTRQELRR